MNAAPLEVVCPLCGRRYGEAEGLACHPTCPLSRGCRLLRCPDCGHEIPAPTRLTRWLARWLGRGVPVDAGRREHP